MCDERLLEGRSYRRFPLGAGPVVANRRGLGLLGSQPARQRRLVGEGGAGRPRRLVGQDAGGLDRERLPVGEDREEVVLMDDTCDARHRDDVVDGCFQQVRAGPRGSDDAGMEHVLEGQVVDESPATEDLVGKVDPGARHAGVVRQEGHLEGRIARIDVEVDVLGEVGVAEHGAVRCAERAVADRDSRLVHVEAGRGSSGEQATDLGTHPAHRCPGHHDRHASGGEALVGRDGGVRGDRTNPCGRHAQLLRGDLGQRGDHPLSELDLADPEVERAVRVRSQPGGQARVGRKGLRELGRHAPDSAASTTASTNRWCVPQRHRLRSRAAATSSRVGWLFSRSRAAADIRMPGTQ